MNDEFNNCLRFEWINETIARTIDRKLQIVDGSGCWSYLGAIPADMTGQKRGIIFCNLLVTCVHFSFKI